MFTIIIVYAMMAAAQPATTSNSSATHSIGPKVSAAGTNAAGQL